MAEPVGFADGLGVGCEQEACGSFQDVAAAVCHVGTESSGFQREAEPGLGVFSWDTW